MSHQPTALVTGSSNGIGEAVVKKLARLDYKLIVTGRNAADISRVADLCAQMSPSNSRPLEIVANLALEPDVDRLFGETMRHFENRLDLLVNNAGLNWPVECSQVDECYKSFKLVMQVNLNSAVRLTLLAGEKMRETASKFRNGTPTSIVFIGSLASQRPTEGLAAYSTSKAALSMFSKSIASELGPLVRVNCIEPGPIATKIVERAGQSTELFAKVCAGKAVLKRIGSPEEVAEAVVFFADDTKSGFITGAQLVVDGGCLAEPIRWTS